MRQRHTTSKTTAKTRADHKMESAEDYVELIDELQREVGAAHITDIAARFGVSHVTAHKTVKRLKTLGLVHSVPYRAVTLTEEGKRLAEDSRRRHEITLRFLLTLGVSRSEAEMDAEGLEHHVGVELLEQMKRFCDLMEENGVVTREDLSPEGE